ncbi:hypothetical protein [Ottowia thiooxydans]|uniref:hypothetical protein n=1 Tax=Ottowia thiooxydans TaxID=219182 RepID=UPI000418CE8F|nr:hypothetical protein [Ottowia thiooxydans]
MHLFQFFHDDATRALLDPDFAPLNNMNSAYPDLFEHASVSQVLRTGKFNDNEYIGFFCPWFNRKTAMTGRQVKDRLAQFSGDVISFSSAFEQIASYPNSFVQGDIMHPGLLNLAQTTLNTLDININLNNLVQDQTRIIFRNYFVAKYSFWVEWLELTERLLKITETKGSVLGARLNSQTLHHGRVEYPMKIFMMERMVSVLLEMKGMDAEIGIDLERAPLTSEGAEDFFNVLLRLEALKGHFLKTQAVTYRQTYEAQRQRLFRSIAERSSDRLALKAA